MPLSGILTTQEAILFIANLMTKFDTYLAFTLICNASITSGNRVFRRFSFKHAP
jgi:hypothetical protein